MSIIRKTIVAKNDAPSLPSLALLTNPVDGRPQTNHQQRLWAKAKKSPAPSLHEMWAATNMKKRSMPLGCEDEGVGMAVGSAPPPDFPARGLHMHLHPASDVELCTITLASVAKR